MLETILVDLTKICGDNRILSLKQRECVYIILASKLNFVPNSSIPSCYFELLLQLVRMSREELYYSKSSVVSGSRHTSPGMSECLVREILRIDGKIRSTKSEPPSASQTKDLSTETNVPDDYNPVPQGRMGNPKNSLSSAPKGSYAHLITMLPWLLYVNCHHAHFFILLLFFYTMFTL